MKLSIITINYNDAVGLQRTLDSVRSQTFTDYEQIIVDGGSTDGSVDIIKSLIANSEWLTAHPLKWVSEPDKGVYDAQNKGIAMATGEYCFFLNSGDIFCNDTVLERIFAPATQLPCEPHSPRQSRLCAASPEGLVSSIPSEGLAAASADASALAAPDLIYGNEPVVENGKRVGYCKGVENPTFLDLYNSCMKHQATFIRRELFERFGRYDISLRIEADYEWFFRVIAFHDDVTLQYVDVDVANFDNEGVSNHSPLQCAKEDEIIRSRYMSKRMREDYALLKKYRNIRYSANYKLTSMVVLAMGKIAKFINKNNCKLVHLITCVESHF